MASGSESAAERVEPIWEVGPTEHVVRALMEALVDPHFPLTVSSVPPSEDEQIAVAKQMHAVVLLYNYHHRKQKPKLEFIEFVNFCKLAIVIRPHLTAFMKMVKKSNLTELNGAEDCLSVTEKAIKDACDISLGLDASRDVPNMEGWPISKVAVLLIDSKKDNFMLQFGAVTTGAWSLIEKDLSESSITPEISTGDQFSNKRKRDNLKVSTYYTEFLQMGYDAVKDVTGISNSDLEVLETHMAYSLSKEKSAACFYIMQYSGSFNEDNEVPLCVVESIQGPIAEKFADGSWKATRLVEFHHVLPYVEFILCWISGCGTKVNSFDKKAIENCCSNNKCDVSSHEHVGSPVDIFQSTESDGNLTKKLVKSFDILDSAESCQNGILENITDESEEPDKGLSCNPSRGLCEMVVDVDNPNEEFEKGCDLADPATEVVNSDTESDVPVSGHLLLGKTVVDDNVREKFNEKLDVGHSAEKDERRICPEILDEDTVGCGKNISSGPPRALKRTIMNHLTNICSHSEDSKRLNSKLKVYHHRSKKKSALKIAAQLCKAVPDLKVDMVDTMESNHTQRRDEKVSEEKGFLTNTCNQTGTASTGDQQAQLEAKIKHNIEVQSASDSLMPDHIQSRDETVSQDKDDHTKQCNRIVILALENQLARTLSASGKRAQHTNKIKRNIEVQKIPDSVVPDHIRSRDEGNQASECNGTGIAATEDQLAQHTDKINHNIEVQSTSDSVMPDHIRSRDEGNHANECNRTGIAAIEDQPAQHTDKIKHNIEVQSTSDSVMPDHIRSRDEGNHANECNRTGIAAIEDQPAQHTDKIKHNIEVQSTSDSVMPDHIRSRDEGNHANECNRTGIAATENQVAQFEAEFNHDLGVQTLSAPDQRQNALALICRKRQELYSELCNREDKLALCEDDVARIRDGGEVDLARQYVESVISGNFDSLLENGTQVQDNGNQHEKNCKSQHGKSTRLSEAYLPGKSSCQDLEYTCERNNWRLPRYLTESLDGKFRSNVFVQGKEFKLQAKGGFVSNPCEARETAAAEMITVMKNTFL